MYPYEYIDSFKKLSEVKLPDSSKFYSSLKAQCIREKDYLRTINFNKAGLFEGSIFLERSV